MTREDIIRMAREAGMTVCRDEWVFGEMLERFAALVAAAEREACAKVCESMRGECWAYDHDRIAAAIREALAHAPEVREQPAQQSAERVEPVAWTDENFMALYVSEDIAEDQGANIRLYTRPAERKLEDKSLAQAREPLTDEQIEDLYFDGFSIRKLKEFARAIEAAHGIGEKK